MISVTVKVARELGWKRLLVELKMCQDLCDVIDKELGPYLTILGRMAHLNLAGRLKELPSTHKVNVYRKWAGEAQWYGPWTLIKQAKGSSVGLLELRNVNLFLERKTLLKPEFPWGVLTLGGLMRAYAEMSEMIYDEIPDNKQINYKRTKKPNIGATFKGMDFRGWEYRRIAENEGRVSWQENLMDAYSFGGNKKHYKELFIKGQINAWMKNAAAEVKRVKTTRETDKKKLEQDRLRYERKIEAEATGYPQALKTFDAKYKGLSPNWTKAGRVKWQTFIKDRISLIGDIYGLVRGATISGTTSDHAYSFFQLCNDVRIMPDNCEEEAYLIKGVNRRTTWSEHTTETLQAALKAMKTDEGFGRIVRLTMLIPIIQMGIEMHHSVHEMASVIGLNFLINWQVGYYDTLFMTLGELRSLEGARMRSGPSPNLQDAAKIEKVETKIKTILKEATQKTCPGYFVTLDPHLVTLRDNDWGGVVMTKSSEKVAHQRNSIIEKEVFTELNKSINAISYASVTSGEGISPSKGITKSYIEQHLLKKSLGSIRTQNSIGQLGAGAPTEQQIKAKNQRLWTAYKTACKVK